MKGGGRGGRATASMSRALKPGRGRLGLDRWIFWLVLVVVFVHFLGGRLEKVGDWKK